MLAHFFISSLGLAKSISRDENDKMLQKCLPDMRCVEIIFAPPKVTAVQRCSGRQQIGRLITMTARDPQCIIIWLAWSIRARLVEGRFRGLVLKTTHYNQQKADVRGHVGIHAQNLANHSSQNLHKLYLKIETRFGWYSGRCDLLWSHVRHPSNRWAGFLARVTSEYIMSTSHQRKQFHESCYAEQTWSDINEKIFKSFQGEYIDWSML
jgi:hypothetical protein